MKTLVILIVAAALEVGGDALIRTGLRGRGLAVLGGAVVLFAYGVLVNKSDLDFNRLMGVYIAVFFVVSQLIALIAFRQIPDDRIILGGGFIIAGGLVIMVMS